MFSYFFVSPSVNEKYELNLDAAMADASSGKGTGVGRFNGKAGSVTNHCGVDKLV